MGCEHMAPERESFSEQNEGDHWIRTESYLCAVDAQDRMCLSLPCGRPFNVSPREVFSIL